MTLDDAFKEAGTSRSEMRRLIRNEIWGGREREYPIEWFLRVYEIMKKNNCLESYKALQKEVKESIITNPLGNL